MLCLLGGAAFLFSNPGTAYAVVRLSRGEYKLDFYSLINYPNCTSIQFLQVIISFLLPCFQTLFCYKITFYCITQRYFISTHKYTVYYNYLSVLDCQVKQTIIQYHLLGILYQHHNISTPLGDFNAVYSYNQRVNRIQAIRNFY